MPNYLGYGIVGSLFGIVLLGMSHQISGLAPVAVVVLFVASIALSIGIVATGVSAGMKHYNDNR